jgi:hypothetical protein
MAPVPPMSSDPAALSPEQCARAVAALLATGLVRRASSLLPSTSPPQPEPENLSESDANRLAEPGDKSVTVSPVN